mmetsp:Transcript_3849/g.8475  ORF Transcript_3849/g.8475 Transcript_3849/m.8475 type:complete len:266 (-) Transcript_3849:1123-1920(-)
MKFAAGSVCVLIATVLIGGVSGQCPCEFVVGAECAVLTPINDGTTCTESVTPCDRCECVPTGGSLLCATNVISAYVFTGTGTECSLQEVTYAECPAGTVTPDPTATATATPTAVPTAIPTAEPTAEPSTTPTAVPTADPTAEPTPTPTESLGPSVDWIRATAGDSCDTACAAVGGTCNPVDAQTLNDIGAVDTDLYREILANSGITCVGSTQCQGACNGNQPGLVVPGEFCSFSAVQTESFCNTTAPDFLIARICCCSESCPLTA